MDRQRLQRRDLSVKNLYPPRTRLSHSMCRCFSIFTVCGVVLLTVGSGRAADPGVEFFEKKIRPILIESCYECHSSGAKAVKGGLKLDTRTAILKGGDSGKVVLPGKPKESLLIEAVRYTNSDLKMPPKGKLPDAVIADLEKWIAMGAPASA